MKEKLMELCKNKEFAETICSLKTEAEVVEFVKKNGIEVNSLEELKALVQPKDGELDAGELNEAAGGIFVCFLVGLGGGSEDCMGKGKGFAIDTAFGFGQGACVGIGVGAGAVIGM